jgi:hypothetical protein
MIKDSTSLFPGFITINSNNEGAYIFDRASSFVYKGALTNNATGTYGRNIKSGVAALCKQHSALVGEISAAISARLEKPQTLTEWATIYTNNIDIYDAFFQDLRADMLSLKTTFVLPNLSIYMIGDETFVHISDPSNIISNGDIYLPSQYKQGTGGRVIFLIVTETNTPPTLQSNGGYIVDNFVSPTPSYLQTYQLSNGVLYMIVATNKRYNNGTVWYIKNIG